MIFMFVVVFFLRFFYGQKNNGFDNGKYGVLYDNFFVFLENQDTVLNFFLRVFVNFEAENFYYLIDDKLDFFVVGVIHENAVVLKTNVCFFFYFFDELRDFVCDFVFDLVDLF